MALLETQDVEYSSESIRPLRLQQAQISGGEVSTAYHEVYRGTHALGKLVTCHHVQRGEAKSWINMYQLPETYDPQERFQLGIAFFTAAIRHSLQRNETMHTPVPISAFTKDLWHHFAYVGIAEIHEEPEFFKRDEGTNWYIGNIVVPASTSPERLS